jgi:hypothetical protein
MEVPVTDSLRQEISARYRSLSNEDMLAALAADPSSFTVDARAIIVEEAIHRNFTVPATFIAENSSEAPATGARWLDYRPSWPRFWKLFFLLLILGAAVPQSLGWPHLGVLGVVIGALLLCLEIPRKELSGAAEVEYEQRDQGDLQAPSS